MARTTKITKEIILEAAYQLLLREGYSNVNIKTIAKEIGCSTQPISWHFGNIENLRRQLYQYAIAVIKKELPSSREDIIQTFLTVGRNYLMLAYERPNLFRFLYMDDVVYNRGDEKNILKIQLNTEIIEKLAEHYHVSKELTGQAVQDTIIYTHGLATMIVSGVYQYEADTISNMAERAGKVFLSEIGVNV